jgi:hypothetical protein
MNEIMKLAVREGRRRKKNKGEAKGSNLTWVEQMQALATRQKRKPPILAASHAGWVLAPQPVVVVVVVVVVYADQQMQCCAMAKEKHTNITTSDGSIRRMRSPARSAVGSYLSVEQAQRNPLCCGDALVILQGISAQRAFAISPSCASYCFGILILHSTFV